MTADVYLRAADIFIEREVPHVCWALGMADGFDSREFARSPVVQQFQGDFAALEAGAEILQSGDMLNAVEGEQGFRELSLWLLAMAAAVAEAEKG